MDYGLTSKWLANGCNHSQTAAGKDMAIKDVVICGQFNPKKVIIWSQLYMEYIRGAPFMIKSKYCFTDSVGFIHYMMGRLLFP